jgi:ubiquinone/menaquinone biosynthesis C-methylase UbiE
MPPIVGASGKVTGLDFNGGRLAVAANLPRPGGCGIEWVEGDAGDLPFDDSTFDIVFCQQGLQFFPDKPAALAAMNRVLVTDGKLILGVWRSTEHQPGGNAMADALVRHISEEAGAIRREPFSFGDAEIIRTLVTSAGFRNIEVRPTIRKVRFPSAEAFTKRYISARTPLNQMVAAASQEQREAVVNDVNAALARYETDNGLDLPTAVNVVVARA